MSSSPITLEIALLHAEIARHQKERPLPCMPCPHNSACCAYGTMLSAGEARRLLRSHGPTHVYRTRWNEWRTRIRGGRCVFFQKNGCSLHDTPDYPTVCRGFPFTDGTGKYPYGDYADICPEMPGEGP
ncbi:MAG: YkgJ family cysteine cluster protein [Candidatus Brocadiae bacterium]|nr:YkgJ family cysteine cluster protein [Candidatus Brocadiia bacterium]